MFMLKRNPSRVSQIPLFADCSLLNLKIKIGAINMASGMVGTTLLIRVNIKRLNPRRNQSADEYFVLSNFDFMVFPLSIQ